MRATAGEPAALTLSLVVPVAPQRSPAVVARSQPDIFEPAQRRGASDCAKVYTAMRSAAQASSSSPRRERAQYRQTQRAAGSGRGAGPIRDG